MQPQNEPPGPTSQPGSINHQQISPQDQPSEKFSSPHPLGPPSSIHVRDLGGAESLKLPPNWKETEQNGTSVRQGLPNDQNALSPSGSRSPTFSSLERGAQLSQPNDIQFIPQDDSDRNRIVATTVSRTSRQTSAEAADVRSADPAVTLNEPVQERKHSGSGADVDAPHLPYPDIGSGFYDRFDDQREPDALLQARSLHSQSEPSSTHRNIHSRDPNSLLHGGNTPEGSRAVSVSNNNLESSQRVHSALHESNAEKLSQGALSPDNSLSLGEQRPRIPKERPFSFMEFSPGKSPKPVQEVLQHGRSEERSEERSARGNKYERDPSPVSPQRSSHNLRSQYIQAGPAHDDDVDDFLPSEKQLELASQSSLYHSQDPNLHEHPAFRQGPTSARHSYLRAEENPIGTPHRISVMQHQKIPPAVPPHSTVSTSRQSPRDSSFLPAPMAASANTEGQLSTATSEHEDPRYKAAFASGKRTKRVSLFRSLNGRKSKDRDPDGDAQETIAPLASHIEPQLTSKVDTKRSESTKIHRKLQRASSSAIAEQDTGKKRRFSALGVSRSLLSNRAFMLMQM